MAKGGSKCCLQPPKGELQRRQICIVLKMYRKRARSNSYQVWEKNFHRQVDKAVDQIVQRACGITIPDDTGSDGTKPDLILKLPLL